MGKTHAGWRERGMAIFPRHRLKSSEINRVLFYFACSIPATFLLPERLAQTTLLWTEIVSDSNEQAW